MPLPPSPPSSVTLYAAMRGSRVVYASQSRSAVSAIADDLGAKLSVGFFIPLTDMATRRRAPAPSTNGHGKDVMTLEEVAKLKHMPPDSVRYAIKSKQLAAHMTSGGIGLGRSKLMVKSNDAKAWEPGANFKRLK